jgi:hypothetical protein
LGSNDHVDLGIGQRLIESSSLSEEPHNGEALWKVKP